MENKKLNIIDLSKSLQNTISKKNKPEKTKFELENTFIDKIKISGLSYAKYAKLDVGQIQTLEDVKTVLNAMNLSFDEKKIEDYPELKKLMKNDSL